MQKLTALQFAQVDRQFAQIKTTFPLPTTSLPVAVKLQLPSPTTRNSLQVAAEDHAETIVRLEEWIVSIKSAPDRPRTWDFPSGSHEFMGGEEQECGAYQFCSLFSPAFESPIQESATTMAYDVIEALFAHNSGSGDEGLERARLVGQSVAKIQTTRRSIWRLERLNCRHA